jgi:hypothetical protein
LTKTALTLLLHKAKESDTIDALIRNKDGTELVKRVVLYKVYAQSATTDRPKICMIVWKSGFANEGDDRKQFKTE